MGHVSIPIIAATAMNCPMRNVDLIGCPVLDVEVRRWRDEIAEHHLFEARQILDFAAAHLNDALKVAIDICLFERLFDGEHDQMRSMNRLHLSIGEGQQLGTVSGFPTTKNFQGCRP